jgi:hypothetical protein
MEFFATLYEKKPLQSYATTLMQLQDDLGWRNDLAVADGLLRDLAVAAPDAAVGAAYARGFLASRMAEDYGKLKTLWSEFKRLCGHGLLRGRLPCKRLPMATASYSVLCDHVLGGGLLACNRECILSVSSLLTGAPCPSPRARSTTHPRTANPSSRPALRTVGRYSDVRC